MTHNGIIQIFGLFAVLLLLVKPLGSYMARVYTGQAVLLSRIVGPLERWIYRVCGVHPEGEMDWKDYARSLLFFHAAGFLLLYLLQRLQGFLPLNPQNLPAVAPDLAFNTAVSFVTNTNWQAYGGETTMSFFTQMAGAGRPELRFRGVGNGRTAAFIRGLATANPSRPSEMSGWI